jgi:hypothetical protein
VVPKKRHNDAVYVAMPSYNGWYSGGAMMGVFERGTSRYRIMPGPYNSSLITKCFNVLWVRAIQSGCRYWAMIHADVSPPPLWIDRSIDEMLRLKATIMSSCIAIKDDKQLVSTALCMPGTTEPHHILLDTELDQLPLTFTGYDVNAKLGIAGDLLVNTGLWVADLDADWVKRVWFDNRARIDWDGDDAHISQASEDWLLSQQLHSLGVTVYATQKLRVGHLGQKEWVCGKE